MIAAVISLNRQLEGARFAQFWADVEHLRDLVNPVVGFYDAVRDYIVYLIESTFQKVSTANLAQSVRLEGASLDSMVSCPCHNLLQSISAATAWVSWADKDACGCRSRQRSGVTAGRSGRTAQLLLLAAARRKQCRRG